MAFTKIPLPSGQWTQIGHAATLTFQNVSSRGIYINATTTNTAPIDEVGLYYDIFQGELKANTALITSGGGTYVWAKPVGAAASIIVES